jgi:hypothetical protein
MPMKKIKDNKKINHYNLLKLTNTIIKWTSEITAECYKKAVDRES